MHFRGCDCVRACWWGRGGRRVAVEVPWGTEDALGAQVSKKGRREVIKDLLDVILTAAGACGNF